jgi:hypothetical protein
LDPFKELEKMAEAVDSGSGDAVEWDEDGKKIGGIVSNVEERSGDYGSFLMLGLDTGDEEVTFLATGDVLRNKFGSSLEDAKVS